MSWVTRIQFLLRGSIRIVATVAFAATKFIFPVSLTRKNVVLAGVGVGCFQN
jgi:hypothetical protein